MGNRFADEDNEYITVITYGDGEPYITREELEREKEKFKKLQEREAMKKRAHGADVSSKTTPKKPA